MKQRPFLIILAVLIGAVIYTYFAAEQPIERGMTLTPKQYIERVEENKRQRREERREQTEEAASGDTSR